MNTCQLDRLMREDAFMALGYTETIAIELAYGNTKVLFSRYWQGK